MAVQLARWPRGGGIKRSGSAAGTREAVHYDVDAGEGRVAEGGLKLR